MPPQNPNWSQQEDEQLRRLVEEYGPKKWSIIASKMRSKGSKQCRRRWKNFLNADLKTGGWTPEEDRILIEGHRQYGNRWTEIAKLVGGRTDNAVKNRWAAICKRVQKSGGRGFPSASTGVRGKGRKRARKSEDEDEEDEDEEEETDEDVDDYGHGRALPKRMPTSRKAAIAAQQQWQSLAGELEPAEGASGSAGVLPGVQGGLLPATALPGGPWLPMNGHQQVSTSAAASGRRMSPRTLMAAMGGSPGMTGATQMLHRATATGPSHLLTAQMHRLAAASEPVSPSGKRAKRTYIKEEAPSPSLPHSPRLLAQMGRTAASSGSAGRGSPMHGSTPLMGRHQHQQYQSHQQQQVPQQGPLSGSGSPPGGKRKPELTLLIPNAAAEPPAPAPPNSLEIRVCKELLSPAELRFVGELNHMDIPLHVTVDDPDLEPPLSTSRRAAEDALSALMAGSPTTAAFGPLTLGGDPGCLLSGPGTCQGDGPDLNELLRWFSTGLTPKSTTSAGTHAGLGTSRLRTPRGNGPSLVGQGQPGQQAGSGAAGASSGLHSPRMSTRASTKASTPRGGSANGMAAAAGQNGQGGSASTPRTAGSQQQQQQQHLNGALSPHSAATLHEGHKALLAKLLTAAMESAPPAAPAPNAGPGPSSTAAQQTSTRGGGSAAGAGAAPQGPNAPPAGGRMTRSGAAPFGLNLGSPSTGSPRGAALLRSPRPNRNSMAAAAAAGAANSPAKAGSAAAAGSGGQGRQGGTGAAGTAAEVQDIGSIPTGAQAAAALAAALPPLPLSAGGRSTRRSNGINGTAAAAGGGQASHPGPSGALQLQTGLNGAVASPGAGGPPSWLNGGLGSLGGLGPLSSVRSEGLGGMWGRDVQVVTPNMSQHELQMLLDALVAE